MGGLTGTLCDLNLSLYVGKNIGTLSYDRPRFVNGGCYEPRTRP